MDTIQDLPSSSASSAPSTPQLLDADHRLLSDIMNGTALQAGSSTDHLEAEDAQLSSVAPLLGSVDLLPSSTSDANASLADLLKDPVEFVPFDETTLGVGDKYTPINSPESSGDDTVVSKNSIQTAVAGPSTLSIPRPIFCNWLSQPLPPPGLTNRGNTCFANAALQALMFTAPLVNFILQDGLHEHCPHMASLMADKARLKVERAKAKADAAAKAKAKAEAEKAKAGPQKAKADPVEMRQDTERPEVDRPPFCTLCALSRMVHAVHRRAKKQFIYPPRELVENVQRYAPHFKPCRQEDAHEFLLHLFANIGVASSPPPNELKGAATTPPTLIQQIFEIQFRSRVLCGRCGNTSDTPDPRLDFALDMANDLYAAVRASCWVEKLTGDNKYRCDRCKMNVNAQLTSAIASLPPILVVHLKRFNNNGVKLKRPVRYPVSLDLRQFLAKDCPQQDSSKYSLYAVLCHIGGTIYSGHYTCYVKIPDQAGPGTWYECNDEQVQRCNGDAPALSNQHAYILFYVRNDSKPKPNNAGATVANLNGKRVVMSPAGGEEEDEQSKPPQKRPKVEDKGMTSVLAGMKGKSKEDTTGKWKTAPMQAVSDDVGVHVTRSDTAASGKNANGKRAADDNADDSSHPAKRRTPPLLSPTLPAQSPGASLPSRPAVPFAGASMPDKTSATDAAGKFKPKPLLGVTSQPAALVLGSSPSSSKKRKAEDPADERASTPIHIGPEVNLMSSPLTSLPPSKPAPPAYAGRFNSAANPPIRVPSPKRQRTSPPPDAELDDGMGVDYDVKPPRPKKKSKFVKNTYGGRNPMSVLVGGGSGGRRRSLM